MVENFPQRPGRSDVARILLAIALVTAALALATVLSDVLLLIFAGVLVGVALRGSARWLQSRTGLPVGAGLAVVGFGVVAAVAAFVWLVGPELGTQSDQLVDQIDAWRVSLLGWLAQRQWADPLADKLKDNVGRGLSFAATHLTSAAFSTFGLIGSVVVVLFTGLYLAIGPAVYRRGAIRLVPIRHRPRAKAVLTELDRVLRLWLLGRAIDMTAVVGMTYAGLALLGQPLALALAIFAGVLNFVPYIGAFVGAIPAILVALGQSPTDAAYVAGLFAVIQAIEGYLLGPAIDRRTVAIPPAVTILSQTVFGTLLGFMGLLLAPALGAVLIALTRMLYVEDGLGDRQGADTET